MKKKLILKVLVGSRACGLATNDSDWDYRGVYINSTSNILSLGYKYKGSHWCEGETEDNTAYELQHFLKLAIHSNPSILEVFKAPIITITKEGKELRDLFPYVWSPKRAFDAFTGYGYNQRKKMLKNKDKKANKYASTFIRALYYLKTLLKTRDFSLILPQTLQEQLREYKKDNFTSGKVIDQADNLIKECKEHLNNCKNTQDITKVNKFLLKVRQHNWNL